MLSIGPYVLDSQVLLAPMAGVTDLPFRQICRAFGAGLTTSEMVTSDTKLWSSQKSSDRLASTNDMTCPNSIQIAGSDPKMLGEAAKMAASFGAQIIDINMGCPAKKVCKKLAGSALLQDESLVADILSCVVSSVDIPVTLKTRTGWDTANKNGVNIAKIAESEGVQALAIHGRTRACKFLGNAEYDTIGEIVNSVTIPVIANGDIDSPEKAQQVLSHTGASAVMIGRKAFGNPWIFEQTSSFLHTGITPKKPSLSSVCKMMKAHFLELYNFYGDYKGVRLARKHFGWYCQNHIPGSSTAIKEFNKLETSQSQIDAVVLLTERHTLHEEKAA